MYQRINAGGMRPKEWALVGTDFSVAHGIAQSIQRQYTDDTGDLEAVDLVSPEGTKFWEAWGSVQWNRRPVLENIPEQWLIEHRLRRHDKSGLLIPMVPVESLPPTAITNITMHPTEKVDNS